MSTINKQSNKIVRSKRDEKEQGFFFVVGRGRSGTSLLQTILNQNSKIAIAPEAQFIMYLWKRYSQKKNWDQATKLKFLKDLWKEKRLHNWNLDADVLQEEILNIAPERSNFSTLCQQVYIQYGHAQDKEKGFICGDKNPHYALYIERLMTFYPNSKFIYLIRDPRSNIISYQNVDFDLQSLPALAQRWNLYNQAILKTSRKYPDKFHFVRFEDLLQNPEDVLSQICQFLGVAYDPAMLDFYKKEQEWKTSFRKNLSSPLDPSKINSWQKNLTLVEAGKVEAICGKLMEKFKYYPINNENRAHLSIRDFFSIRYATFFTFLEKIIYYFPIEYFEKFIDLYRRKTKTY